MLYEREIDVMHYGDRVTVSIERYLCGISQGRTHYTPTTTSLKRLIRVLNNHSRRRQQGPLQAYIYIDTSELLHNHQAFGISCTWESWR